MPLTEIVNVSLSSQPAGLLWGCYIDTPVHGALYDGSVVDTWGWVLGRVSRVLTVEFFADGTLLRRVPVNVRRPDIQTAYPHVSGAEHSGFRTVIPVEGRLARQTIEIRCTLKDGTRVSVGEVVARRRWREANSRGGVRLVSVIIPCYNQALYLGDAIESALAQTHPHVEIVVIDDGSPDNTGEITTRYPGVRCIRQDNEGLPAARNTGLRRSNGDYLVFLDADDRLVPTAIDAGLRALDAHPEAAFTSGRCRWIGTDGLPLPTPDHGPGDDDHYAALLRSNYTGMPATVMYRRAVFEVAHGFDPSPRGAEDYELLLRIARQFPVCAHDDMVAEYRIRGESMSRDPALLLQSVLSVLRAQRRHIRGSRDHRQAYRDGVRFWTRYYGQPLAHQLTGFAQRREWRHALRALRVLAWRYPAGLRAALTGSAKLG